jgi:predicted anti-sigma-YlaC factor YlaD
MKSNRCEAYFGEIAAYLAGERELSGGAAVHLRECAECRVKVAELKTVAALHAEGAARIPEPKRRLNRQRLMRSLEKEEERGPSFGWARPVLAALAVMMVATSVVLWNKRNEPVIETRAAISEGRSSSAPFVPVQTILALHQELRDGRELLPIDGQSGKGIKHYRLRDVQRELEN